MDLNLLIGALSFLLAALVEGRNVLRENKKDEAKSIGIFLLQIIFTLDNIIETGEELIGIIANIPIKGEKVYETLQNKDAILSLVKKQQKQLSDLSELLETSLDHLDPNITVPVGQVIELMTSSKEPLDPNSAVMRKLLLEKSGLLEKFEWGWKTLKGRQRIGRIRSSIKLALSAFSDPMTVDSTVGDFSIRLPTKIQIGILQFNDGFQKVHILGQEPTIFDLTRHADLRRLLETSNLQLKLIKDYRHQLSDIVQENFSLKDLI